MDFLNLSLILLVWIVFATCKSEVLIILPLNHKSHKILDHFKKCATCKSFWAWIQPAVLGLVSVLAVQLE